MQPIEFALEIETLIHKQLTDLSDTPIVETTPLITLLRACQTELIQLLATAQTINIDSMPLPAITEQQLLGADAAWQQISQHITAGTITLQGLFAYWSIHTAVDKAVQFYQQATANNAHPQFRLFFSSLAQIKKLQRRRLDGIMQIYYNNFWGELGFAPFLLGKD